MPCDACDSTGLSNDPRYLCAVCNGSPDGEPERPESEKPAPRRTRQTDVAPTA